MNQRKTAPFLPGKPKAPNPAHYITLTHDADQALHELVAWLQAQFPDRKIGKSDAVRVAVESTREMVTKDFFRIPLGPAGEILTIKGHYSENLYWALNKFVGDCEDEKQFPPETIAPETLRSLRTGDGIALVLCTAIETLFNLVAGNQGRAMNIAQEWKAGDSTRMAAATDQTAPAPASPPGSDL